MAQRGGGGGSPVPLRQTACMTKDLTPTEALITLQRAKAGAKAVYWRHFRPEINPERGLACLLCNACDSYLGASNPARSASEHFGKSCGSNPVCRVQAKDAAKVQRTLKRPALDAVGKEDFMDLTTEAGTGGSGEASTSMSQQSMHRYIGPPPDVVPLCTALVVYACEQCFHRAELVTLGADLHKADQPLGFGDSREEGLHS
eukprot:357794-Chlamydomonas_euryale.AAC.9